MRVLCLHGNGSNSQIFEMQTAALRYELQGHEFEFVEGSIPAPAAPGVHEAFPDETEFFMWLDYEEPETAVAAFDDLRSYISSNGPFDGVLAFSAGAQLVSSLLIMESLNPTMDTSVHDHLSIAGIRFAIFICSTAPLILYDISTAHDVRPDISGDETAGSVGSVGRMADPDLDGQAIKIPTANIVSSRDTSHIDYSMLLVNLCDEKRRILLDHGGDHEIPRGVEITKRMADCIRSVIHKAEFTS